MSIPLLLTLASLSAGPPGNVPPCPTAEDAPDVAGLVKRTEQLLEGKSSTATISMQIKTPSWSRKLKLRIQSTGKQYALIKILEGGPREVGMMTLKRDNQLWNYLPQAGRVMKLPSGMMGDSWLGSDFTNDDLVKGSSLTDDFASKVNGTVEQDGRKAWQITLTPKPNAVVVWGKIEMLVDRQTCVPLLERFYDEEGKPARKLTFSDIKKVGWRDFPSRLTVQPAEAGRETTLVYEQITFDEDIPEDTYGLHHLQKGQ
ncbi:MAG TPA: outer membrane lipoprotein-sorting protein [Myxococcaceae bacterium]|nr:outer membrane lipoprotein-sorting protein [Myxococcaceae bacterium]